MVNLMFEHSQRHHSTSLRGTEGDNNGVEFTGRQIRQNQEERLLRAC
jgi:hypothetical protein